MLTENEDAVSKTVDGRVLTDRQTHTHTDTQIDRHDQFYDSCPSKMGNYNNTTEGIRSVNSSPPVPMFHLY